MSEATRETPETAVSDRTLAEEMHEHADFRQLAREREEAEGVEVFSDPDKVLPIHAIVEGREGEEAFTSDEPQEDEEPAR